MVESVIDVLPATAVVSETNDMEVLQTDSWQEALELKAAHPEAVPIAGGTDLMVELNFDRIRPRPVLDLTRIPELTEWSPENGRLRVGAGVTYSRLIAELAERLPGLAIASRTVGSPQIRNRGTVGGNLGTSSPAGDALPPLFAADAEVELASRAGTRRIPGGRVRDRTEAQLPGRRRADRGLPHRRRRRPAAVRQDRHPQRDGDRGLLARALDLAGAARRRRVHRLSGADADPVQPRRSDFIAGVLEEHDLWTERANRFPTRHWRGFGELVERAAHPIDDVRGTARYRHHALGVLARRTLTWAWEAYR